jgi:hypothetical protein
MDFGHHAATASNPSYSPYHPPKTLNLPFACWTLERLYVYLHMVEGIPMQDTRMDELLLADGRRWQTQETWFLGSRFEEGSKSACHRPGLLEIGRYIIIRSFGGAAIVTTRVNAVTLSHWQK